MADFEQDYILRMIRDMVRFISTLAFGRTDLMVDIPDMNKADAATVPPWAITYANMLRLVGEGDINSAEDMLYDRLDTSDTGYLEAGLAFYHELCELGDEALESAGYSREEIAEGLRYLSGLYGISGLEQFDIAGDEE